MTERNPTRDPRIHHEPAPAIWDTTNAIVETDASEPAISIAEAYALAEAARVQMEAR